jgi:hypothetical protein
MHFGIGLTAPRTYAQAPDREARAVTKKVVAMSGHKLLLGSLIIILAALLVTVVAGSGVSADIVPSGMDSIGAPSSESIPMTTQPTSLQPWIDTSPYAHEPLSISSGSAGVNLPE